MNIGTAKVVGSVGILAAVPNEDAFRINIGLSDELIPESNINICFHLNRN